MVKLSITVLRTSRPLEIDAKSAMCRTMSPEMQANILGGKASVDNVDKAQICDAVCYPSEMGVCHCYQNLC